MMGPTYSSTFFKTFKETLIACSYDIGGLLAGFIVAAQLHLFQLSPWAIAVYPTIIGAKSVTEGFITGRLSTELHIGTIRPRFLNNTRNFYRLLQIMSLITFGTSVSTSAVSMIFGSMLWEITTTDLLAILFVVVATMTIGLSISLATIQLAFAMFRRGREPDAIAYPTMSAIADIVMTIFYVFMLNLYFLFGFVGRCGVGLVGFLLVVLACYIVPRNIHDVEFVRALKGALFTLMFAASIFNIAGTVLKRIGVIAWNRKVIYTVYPALVGVVEDVGFIVSSTATTRLALGLLPPSFRAIRDHIARVIPMWTVSIMMFILLAGLSLFMNGIFAASVFLGYASLLLLTNVFSVAPTVLVSYAFSVLTFQRGLDPDHLVIPMESSVADSIAAIAMLAALLLIG
jgi:mgtE-like transporter